MASVYETIENSSVIQNAKAAWEKANAAGDEKGKENARRTAETYRQMYGGYTTTADGSAIANIVNRDTYVNVLNSINDITEEVTKPATNVVNKVTDSVKETVNKATEAVEKVTVIDSGYNASDYAISSNSIGSSDFDTYLGYGLIGLVLIAVLSRFINK